MIANLPLIAVGFAKRQTPESRFTHWTCSDEELCAIAGDNLDNAGPGYQGSETKFPHLPHNGICVVPVPEDKLHLFRCGVIVLDPGDELETRYEARRPGEDPRTYTVAKNRSKGPSKSAQIVLYHREVLEADGEDTIATWEIVSVNSSPTSEVPPIQPWTLLSNHYGLSGGTPTGLTPIEFESKLGEAVRWWKDKTMAGRP